MKKTVLLLLVIILVFMASACSGNKNEEKVEWGGIELGQFIPKPEKFNGDVTTNRKDLAIIVVPDVSKNEYKNYIQKVIDDGYNIDLEYELWDAVYGAFNADGYSIRVIFSEYSNEMKITIEIPETQLMSEIEWPTNGLASFLPKPKSILGKISWDNSNTFIVHIGNTTKDDYNDYVEECENEGYIIDYSKSEKDYSAKNEQGYKLHLMYLGANVIEISLKLDKTTQTPEENEQNPSITTSKTDDTAPKTDETTEKDKNENLSTEISLDFKTAMDSYEEFFNKYVDIMKKYNDNPTDMSILSDYIKYMGEYLDMMQKFEEWEEADLNVAEAKYYIEVQGRITKKLLEIAE